MIQEQVILVDQSDTAIGTMEKLQAHEEGRLHRAFSVFVFNSNNELMLHKRASSKYHSGGLWTNTCCSHPRPGEDIMDAAYRRLDEEMGFTCELQLEFSFIYKAKLDNDLTEHELDYVITGRFDGTPKLNYEEAEDWKWVSIPDVKKDLEINSEKYTYWFKIAFEQLFKTTTD